MISRARERISPARHMAMVVMLIGMISRKKQLSISPKMKISGLRWLCLV